MKQNFLDIHEISEKYTLEENSEIVIVPVPYDKTSTWMKGSDKGPSAIVDAGNLLEFYDVEADYEVYKHGIFTDDAVLQLSTAEKMIDSVTNRVDYHLKKGKFVVTLGGEHTISIAPVAAYAKHFKNLTVLQLDAHSDMRSEYLGVKYSHACAMYHIKQYCPVVQVGIRSTGKCELENIDRNRIFYAHEIYDNRDWIKKVVDLLTENVYITIDFDALDPAIMPSTGTPVPGGMQWYDTIELLKEVIKNRNLVGFDAVEFCPNENNKAPDYLAATLIYKMLSFKFAKK